MTQPLSKSSGQQRLLEIIEQQRPRPRAMRPTTEGLSQIIASSAPDRDQFGGIPFSKSVANNSTAYVPFGEVASIGRVSIRLRVVRGTAAEIDDIELWLNHDASAAHIDRQQLFDTTDCGLTLAANISGTTLRLAITTDNSGSAASVKGSYSYVAV